MGWCSATKIFDTVCEVVLDNPSISTVKQKEVIKKLYDVLCDNDWDCQSESLYMFHPIVNKLIEDEDENLD